MSQIFNNTSTGRMIFYMGSSQMVSNAIRIIGGLLIAKLVLPETLGLFNGFALILGYLPIFQFGVMNGLNRELPFYLGKGESEKAVKYAAVAQYWEILLSVISVTIMLGFSVYYLILGNLMYFVGYLTYAISAIQLFYGINYLQILYRTNNDFNRLSVITLILSFVTFISIIFVWLWGYYGLCLRLIILSVLEVFLLWKWKPIKAKPQFDIKIFYQIIKVGLPIYIVGIVFSLWGTFQNTLVLKIGGVEDYGLFALAIMIQSSLSILTNAVNQVIYPKMAFEFGKKTPLEKILRIPVKPILIISAILLPSLIILWYLLPVLVNYFLPQYSAGIPAAQWTLPLIILSVFSVYNSIFNVIKKQKDYLYTIISGIIVFTITLGICYYSWGYSLVIFPIAMFMGKLVQIILAFIYLKKYINQN